MSLDIYYRFAPCSHCGWADEEINYNITYNLSPMWRAAGLPFSDGSLDGGVPVTDLLPALEAGLRELRSDPAKYRLLNPPNGWGSYEGLVSVVEEMIRGAEERPGAVVYFCR